LSDPIPRFSPALIQRFPEPFDDPDWLFEIKYDGFRALAYVRAGTVELVSRTGHVYRQFAPLCRSVAQDLAGTDVVLDGEIACLDETGRTQFDLLMHRRGIPCFVAFDVLWHAGMDVRAVPLWKRKQILRVLVPKRSGALLYADGVARCGTALYLYRDRVQIVAGRFSATLDRQTVPGAPSRLPEHRAAYLAAISGKRGKRYLKRQHLFECGEAAVRFLTELVHRSPRAWVTDVDQLHELLQGVGPEAMERAFRAALDVGHVSVELVIRLLGRSGPQLVLPQVLA